jgi:hypothetical protein
MGVYVLHLVGFSVLHDFRLTPRRKDRKGHGLAVLGVLGGFA